MQAARALARRRAPHAALDRPQAHDRACRRRRGTRATGCSRTRRATAGARHVLTAHTLDDQAETVLIRLTRGSGISGLAAMARHRAAARWRDDGIALVRPLLDVPQGAADRDAAQGRHRLSPTIRPTAIRASPAPGCGRRCRRWRARASTPSGWRCWRAGCGGRRRRWKPRWPRPRPSSRPGHGPSAGRSHFRPTAMRNCRPKIALRLLGRAIARVGNEGPVELGKLEALHAALAGCSRRRAVSPHLAGALVTRAGGRLAVERAPARRAAPPRNGLNQTQRWCGASSARRRPIGLECAGFAGLFGAAGSLGRGHPQTYI